MLLGHPNRRRSCFLKLHLPSLKGFCVFKVSREMQCLRYRGLSGTLPSAWWLIARGSCSKLFVGGLSYDTNEIVLKEAFEQYGEITEAVRVLCDHKSGRSKGYGFVRFTAESAANVALQKMDGQLLDGRNIRVHYAHKG
ncbi:glycine-rich RNA-binding protein 4, mitochondrial-like isoform X2 [Macadamia integrifolia]|uniref:glycine-rich RNA-binding protein 4, mitochondrial-like isoform X2 n=1 Tax=Macadamia integrifolia TaxID=60698 RepID=UPI001C4F8291|nr:glycine-rich RNA-binding protein 4, mitochondrial-like isoform X2 [Macadamia integrifolia]XP_042511865.1 glycine-rich RNA-binding protein 4, mitochondrial-like isoform X2 [Macadamia integrifolia]